MPKHAKESRKRQEKLAQQARYQETFSSALFEDAEAMITRESGNRHNPEPSYQEMSAWLRTRFDRTRKLSNREHVKRLSEVYAGFVYESVRPTFKDWLKELREDLGIRERKNADVLSYVVRAAISYGSDASDDKDAEVEEQKTISRDVRALRYLMNAGILPSAMTELAEQAGEGLNNWARRRPAQRAAKAKSDVPSRAKASPADRSPAASQSALIVQITKENGESISHLFKTPAARRYLEDAIRNALMVEKEVSNVVAGTRRKPVGSIKPTVKRREREAIKLNINPSAR